MRALRSYQYNRVLKPRVETRLTKAQSRLESYLMLRGTNSVRLADCRVEMVEGELAITRLPPDGWTQLEMEGLAGGDLCQSQAERDLGTDDDPDSPLELCPPTR